MNSTWLKIKANALEYIYQRYSDITTIKPVDFGRQPQYKIVYILKNGDSYSETFPDLESRDLRLDEVLHNKKSPS